MRVIQFSPPDISEAEIQEVAAALRSGWITTGPRTKKLEEQLAGYVGVDRAVCLNSCTAAEELIFRVLGIGPGDEVIVPAYTYTASASAALHAGASIRLIDSQKDSLEMDYEAVEKAINAKTKAIVPVDLGGVPCDYDRIFEIVEKKQALFTPAKDIQKAFGRIIVCADGAHALGASRKGIRVGNIADFTAFSFHAVKNFTTAEGGAACWKQHAGLDDEAIYQQFQLLSLHGQNKDALAKTKLGCWEYDIVGPWYKCNMTDVAAAIGLVQLQRYPKLLQRRYDIVKKYDQAMDDLGIEHIKHVKQEYISSHHLYITRLPNASVSQRNAVITEMAGAGVSANVHYKPLPMMTAYKQLGFDIKDYPNAYNLYHNEITLPLHTLLTDEDVDYVIAVYQKVLKEMKLI